MKEDERETKKRGYRTRRKCYLCFGLVIVALKVVGIETICKGCAIGPSGDTYRSGLLQRGGNCLGCFCLVVVPERGAACAWDCRLQSYGSIWFASYFFLSRYFANLHSVSRCCILHVL